MLKLLNIFKIIALIIVLLIGMLAILSTSNPSLASIIPIKPYTVLTGSMRPTIQEGSVVFVDRKTNQFQNNDIITFIRPDNAKENVTHRIVNTEREGNRQIYRTKGDANKVSDPWQVQPEAVW